MALQEVWTCSIYIYIYTMLSYVASIQAEQSEDQLCPVISQCETNETVLLSIGANGVNRCVQRKYIIDILIFRSKHSLAIALTPGIEF